MVAVAGERRYFRMTVISKSPTTPDEAGHWKVLAEVPSLSPKNYPWPLSRISARDAGRLAVGSAYTVELERGRPKAGKDDSPNPYDYYWEWVGLEEAPDPEGDSRPTPDEVASTLGQDSRDLFGQEGAKPEQGSRPLRVGLQGTPQPDRWNNSRDTWTNMSIQRQVALKAAVELAGHNGLKGEIGSTQVLQVAQAFAEWLKEAPNNG